MSRSTTEPADTGDAQARRLRARYRSDWRFRLYGRSAIGLALAALIVLLGSISFQAASVLTRHELRLDVHLDPGAIDPGGERRTEDLRIGNYAALVRDGLRRIFPDVRSRSEVRSLAALVSVGAEYEIQEFVLENPAAIGEERSFRVPLSDDADLFLKGAIERDLAESDRRLDDAQIRWLDELEASGRIHRVPNLRFLTAGDSREPELAGIQGAIRGSFLTLIVTLVLSFPVGVAAAVYLEEFAPRNPFTDLIEVNINNLAAVPSIVFGLLGLAVFLNWFGLPRSAPLVGGLVLALMTLPTIIIASRAALQAVPPSIREAALGVGASPTQAVLHHVLPQAMPGVLTGTIIGMARALGETAPLLMIGMVAFIADLPTGPTDPSTVLPVQIYLWAESPERAWQPMTAGAIVVLLAFLIVMNGLAVLLRARFESRQ